MEEVEVVEMEEVEEVEEVEMEEVEEVEMEEVEVVTEVLVVVELEEHPKNFHRVISTEKIKISFALRSIIVSLHFHSFLLLCVIVVCLSIISMVIFDCSNSNSGRGRIRHCDDCGGGDCYGRDRGGGEGWRWRRWWRRWLRWRWRSILKTLVELFIWKGLRFLMLFGALLLVYTSIYFVPSTNKTYLFNQTNS